MTEGIIEKVLNDLQSDFNRDEETYVECNDVMMSIEKAKQALIKEIDKASRLYGCTCWIETAALIGDKE